MKSPKKQRKGAPASDIEALWPTEPDTDAHNEHINIMLELVQRNQELKEQVRRYEELFSKGQEMDESRTWFWDDDIVTAIGGE